MEIRAQDSMDNTIAVKRKQKIARAYGMKIEDCISKREYTAHEAALAIASDSKYQKNIAQKIAHLMGVDHVILIGIGGSSRGAEAVYKALRHTTTKQLTVLDTFDDEALEVCVRSLRKTKRPESIAVVVVTKSGATAETLMNAASIINVGTEIFGEIFLRRVVFVGDADTPFMKAGKRKKVVCLPIPDVIGGRYSVFTAAGILPLMLLGIDTEAFLRGAATVSQKSIRESIVDHSATLVYLIEKSGIKTVNFFALDKQLTTVGLWYQQLFAESIGKQTTKKRSKFEFQVLPFVSTTVDFHAALQLYLGGYTDAYTYFVRSSIYEEEDPIGEHWLLHTDVAYLAKSSRTAVMHALVDGVIDSYKEAKLPYAEIELAGITPHELGLYMASAMLEVMTVCHLFGINAFDQPQVEFYKKYAQNELTS